MISQRYVSEELTHFVGRGSSDEEEQYSILVDNILKCGCESANVALGMTAIIAVRPWLFCLPGGMRRANLRA
jgi:hypothetical protein